MNDVFNTIKDGLINIDPVAYCQKTLTLDGKPFKLEGNGYKPFSDIFRYIGLNSLKNNAKPIILVKGRQVGATTMAAALELYFMSSGLFGTGGRAPMRIIHAFPTLIHVFQYAKTKFNPMIRSAVSMDDPRRPGKKISVIENRLDKTSPTNDSLQFKQFYGDNFIRIESTGRTADRLRGAQLCLETELPTPNGFVKLIDLKEGDELFDENGNICKITKLHPINNSPESYRIIFDDGTTIDACAKHLWSTQTKNERRKKTYSVKNTKEILESLKVGNESNHSIPTCKAVNYNKKELIIDPYLLGLWLGDGGRYNSLETADPEVLQDYNYKIIKSSINHIGNFINKPSKSNSYRVKNLTTKLKKLGLLDNPGKARQENGDLGFYHKYIPAIYMQSSFDQRLALLQGLMDSDGSCSKGRCEFSQCESRKHLVEQVKDLAQSLGIKVTKIHKKNCSRYNVNYQNTYRIHFVTTLPVFRLQRKLKKLLSKIVIGKNRYIKQIVPIDSKPMRCITVDSPSHLYLVTRSYIPTHNTADCIFYDEIQDINAMAIVNTNKTLTTAQYGKTGKGIQVYFGTPKSRSSEYYKMWESSTQAYYHLGCEKCENYFPLYTPGSNEWEKIWLHGFIVKCPYCDHTQDKRHAAERGKWIHLAFADEKKKLLGEDECDMIGFHINQLYNPRFTKEDIIKDKPENSPIMTERGWQNEVLGEFYAGEMGPITKEEIEEYCADDRKLRASISIAEGKKVFAGFDWGKRNDPDSVGKDEADRQGGQSFSTCVILTEDGPGRLLLDYASIVKKNDFEYKKGFIHEVMRKYSVTQAVGDIGYAHELTEVMQRDYGDRFLASNLVSKVNGLAKLNDIAFPHIILAEREYHIAEVFNVMKRGMIRFPWKDFEKISWLIDHCTGMEVKVTFNVVNEPVRRFVKGAIPNDGFMALLNAYLAYKYYATRGFNNMKGGVLEDSGPKAIPAIIGYCPRM